MVRVIMFLWNVSLFFYASKLSNRCPPCFCNRWTHVFGKSKLVRFINLFAYLNPIFLMRQSSVGSFEIVSRVPTREEQRFLLNSRQKEMFLSHSASSSKSTKQNFHPHSDSLEIHSRSKTAFGYYYCWYSLYSSPDLVSMLIRGRLTPYVVFSSYHLKGSKNFWVISNCEHEKEVAMKWDKLILLIFLFIHLNSESGSLAIPSEAFKNHMWPLSQLHNLLFTEELLVPFHGSLQGRYTKSPPRFFNQSWPPKSRLWQI